MAMQVMCSENINGKVVETGMTTLRDRDGSPIQLDYDDIHYWMNRIAEIDADAEAEVPTTIHYVRDEEVQS